MGYQSLSGLSQQGIGARYAQSRMTTVLENAALPQDASEMTLMPPQATDKIRLLEVEIDNLSKADLLSRLTKGVVFTPNVDHLMKLRRDPEFVAAYTAADFKVCDSQILMYAARFLGKRIKAKISGSDLFPWFCEYHQHNANIRIFLLGAQEGIAQLARTKINQRIGREIVVAAHSPSYGFERNEQECQEILAQVRASSANVLVVGVGAPKQEKWIVKYKDQLPNIDIFMAVGAAIDFEAGCKPRSPQFVSELGLEWLYRLLSEPKRLWKRYLLDDLPFLGLVMAEKLKQLTGTREAFKPADIA